MKQKIKVVQYGIGPIGAGVVELLLSKEQFQIVGAIDVDPNKVGKDLGEVAGVGKELGVIVSNDPKKVFLAAKPDVVVHTTSSFLRNVKDQLAGIIKSGLDVVSSCEELAYPWTQHPELAKEIDRLAKKYKVTVLGTGVNPGFAMDTLVIALTGVCHDVKKISVSRVQDASIRRVPFQRKIGAGLTLEGFNRKVAEGTFGHIGLPESMSMIAAAVGWKIDEIKQEIEPVIADAHVESSQIKVEAGRCAGIQQIAHGFMTGTEVLTLLLRAVIGEKNARDEIDIEGIPNINMVTKGAIHGDFATTGIIVNMIPKVLSAKPGLLTMKDLPVPSALMTVKAS